MSKYPPPFGDTDEPTICPFGFAPLDLRVPALEALPNGVTEPFCPITIYPGLELGVVVGGVVVGGVVVGGVVVGGVVVGGVVVGGVVVGGVVVGGVVVVTSTVTAGEVEAKYKPVPLKVAVTM